MSILNNEVSGPQFTSYKEKLNKAIDHLKNELLSYRAGRANPAILDKLTVDYWGTPTKIRDMANVTVPEPRSLVIAPYDQTAIKAISKAIIESDLGLNPSDDGRLIRLAFPQLTEERRRELIKTIKKTVEDSKVILRNERRDMVDLIKKAKKDNHLTEDDVIAYEKEVQKELDKSIEIVDKMLKDKEQEVLSV